VSASTLAFFSENHVEYFLSFVLFVFFCPSTVAKCRLTYRFSGPSADALVGPADQLVVVSSSAPPVGGRFLALLFGFFIIPFFFYPGSICRCAPTMAAPSAEIVLYVLLVDTVFEVIFGSCARSRFPRGLIFSVIFGFYARLARPMADTALGSDWSGAGRRRIYGPV